MLHCPLAQVILSVVWTAVEKFKRRYVTLLISCAGFTGFAEGFATSDQLSRKVVRGCDMDTPDPSFLGYISPGGPRPSSVWG